MAGLVDTHPVPAVEDPEITSDATTGPGPAEPTASDCSGGGDDSDASCPWSLTSEQQVQNLKENLKRALDWTSEVDVQFGIESSPLYYTKNFADPWFARIVEKLRVDPCLDSHQMEMEQSILRKVLKGAKMTSLDLAILMGDLKMVQKILDGSSVPVNVTLSPWTRKTAHTRTRTYFTPLHLAVLVGDSDIVDALLEKGADVNGRIDGYAGKTPLYLACKMGSVTMLQKLLTKDIDMKDPLHVAVTFGDIDFMKKLPSLNVNALDRMKRTPLHYLATSPLFGFDYTDILQFLAQDKRLDMKALDDYGFSAFYVAVLCGNTKVVIAFLDFFKDFIRLNEACDRDRGPPIQIAFERGYWFEDIEIALMECEQVKSYMDKLYRDRQVYVDAANAILVDAALIASVTFASWLQPPLSYTSYSGEGYSSSGLAPSTSNLNYVDVEHNIALRAF